MPIRAIHRDIIRVALTAVRGKGINGVALAGGNGLLAQEASRRPTEDVDLFVRNLDNVDPATAEIEEALTAAGYQVDRRDKTEGLGDIWDDAGTGMAELIVVPPDGSDEVQVQVAFFEYKADVMLPGLGPVLSMADLAGFKTATVATRQLPRDYVDVASLRERYTTAELLALAAERDPGLGVADYADAAVRLDRMRDSRLQPYLDPAAGQDAAWVRRAFADWPRDTTRDE
jgi:hypothetical protein